MDMYNFAHPPTRLTTGAMVWAYARDSGGTAQEKSVQQQMDAIEAYCKQFGLVLVKTYADVAKSGKDTEGREQFLEMMRACEPTTQRPAAILVWNYARFARNMRQAVINSFQLEEYGIMLVSLTEKYNEDDGWGWIEMLFRHKSNEDARKKISEDARRGLRSVFVQGCSFGNPPRGYKAAEVELGQKRDGSKRKASRWVPDPDLWPLVLLAWKLRAEGKTYDEIQQATGRRLYRSRNCWTTFFTNKAYLGVGVLGDLEIPDHHPAAVDRQTWEKVQELHDGHPQTGRTGHIHHPRRVGVPSLLSGLAFCKHCGAALIHRTSLSRTSVFPHYICGKKDRQGVAACKGRQINGFKLDQTVFDTVRGRILTLDFFYELLEATRAQYADHATLDNQIKAIHDKLRQNQRAIGNLLELAENFGALSAVDNLKKREAEKMDLENQLRDLEEKRAMADIEITPEALTVVLDLWRSQLENAQQSGDVRTVKNFLVRFVTKIEVSYNQVEIYYTYPINDLITRGNTRSDAPRLGAHVEGCKVVIALLEVE